jgi:hypothetical protein
MGPYQFFSALLDQGGTVILFAVMAFYIYTNQRRVCAMTAPLVSLHPRRCVGQLAEFYQPRGCAHAGVRDSVEHLHEGRTVVINFYCGVSQNDRKALVYNRTNMPT